MALSVSPRFVPRLRACACIYALTAATITCLLFLACGEDGGGTTDPDKGVCSFSTSFLNFDSVAVGSTAARTFVLANLAEGEISGVISSSCGQFSVIPDSSYHLAAGQSRTFVVQFRPVSPGTVTCTLEDANLECGNIECTGIGVLSGPACDVSPARLDFGGVAVGESEVLDLTIRNTGDEALLGLISIDCGEFELTMEAGYEIGPGETLSVPVRFSPLATGAFACTLQTGAASCPEIVLLGLGLDARPLCRFDPETVDFGSVMTGQSAERALVLTNAGGGRLAGTVAEFCPEFALTDGADYDLAAGETRTFEIRFDPDVSGSFACTLQTGISLCPEVVFRGSAFEPLPLCQTSSDALDFGDVEVGSSADLAFTVTNTGGGVLTGTVTPSCPEFSVVPNGLYELGAGQSETFQIRFQPVSAGSRLCSLDPGQDLCGETELRGVGVELPPACQISDPSLDFGEVLVGETAERSFTITNTGSGVLAGTVTESCPEFSIAAGPSYALGEGESQTVVVRFSPISTGTKSCLILTGNAACGAVEVSGQGSAGAQCELSASSLDFGTVTIGDTADRDFTIGNTGGGLLPVSLSEDCPEFSLLSEAVFELGPGESRTIGVRYSPSAPGTSVCTLQTGTPLCEAVLLEGSATSASAECELSAEGLDFGEVPVGETAEQILTITNTGASSLAGTVSESCGDFSLPTGGEYALEAGESAQIRIQFAPAAVGLQICRLETGHAFCPDLDVQGTGTETSPVCLVSTESETPADSLNFGPVPVGQTAVETFTITNAGEGELSGQVSEGCAEFEITSESTYALATGESQTFTVSFRPGSAPPVTCLLETGASLCSDLTLTGSGSEPEPVCEVAPISLDFDSVGIGQSSERSFSITNTGGGTLTGRVTEACPEYQLTGPAGYSLGSGDSRVFTLRYTPSFPGPSACLIETGQQLCPDVSAAGTGVALNAVCQVSSLSLDFGFVPIGESAERTFTIMNTGGDTLSGQFSEACEGFSLAGETAYALTSGESHSIVVRFTPSTTGPAECLVETGSPLCTDVNATGIGVSPNPVCELSETALDFGDVLVGEAVELGFTIRNAGGGTLSGQVSESCDDFAIVGDATYALVTGESHTITVRFAPSVAGPAECSIDTGNEACGDVSATGTGSEPPPVCAISVSTIEFGSVPVGETAERAFTIRNTGGGILSGDVSEDCADYAILGETAYALAAGESLSVTVQFAPSQAGPSECVLETGQDLCADVNASGTGLEADPVCEVSQLALDFGSVFIGETAERIFSIKNTGGGVLSGVVTEDCQDYGILGETTYALAAGESLDVTVQFMPSSPGPSECVLETGQDLCADVSASGTGVEADPVCEVSESTLDFGHVPIGETVERSFTIRNSGGGLLYGEVFEDCDEFEIVDPIYVLAAGDSHTVTVQLTVTNPGLVNCIIQTGNPLCADVSATGIGVGPNPICLVDPTGLDFGEVGVGFSADRSFTITNTGGGVLSGAVTDWCETVTVIEGATYLLRAGESQTVTLRYSPVSAEPMQCLVETGNDLCDDVECVGQGVP